MNIQTANIQTAGSAGSSSDNRSTGGLRPDIEVSTSTRPTGSCEAALLVCILFLLFNCFGLVAQDFSGRSADGTQVDRRTNSGEDSGQNFDGIVTESSGVNTPPSANPGPPRWRVGGFIGLGLGLHSATFAELPGVPSCCPGYRDGTSWSPGLALLGNYNFDEQFAAELRLAWAAQSGTLSREQIAGNARLNDQTVNALVDHQLEVDLQHFLSEFAIRYHLESAHLWFDGGFQLAWSLGADFKQSEILLSPDNAVFDNGLAERNQREGTIEDLSPVRLGLQAGISTELPIADQLTMAPTVRFTWSPQNVVDGLDWTVNTLEFGLAFRYDLHSQDDQVRDASPQSQPLRDPARSLDPPVVNNQVEPTQPIAASGELTLKVFGLDADGGRTENPTVQIYRRDSREYLPLLSQVFFDAGSSDLNTSRQNLLTELEAQKFAERQLSGSILEIYYDNLNIIGERMLRDPQAVLTLIGRMPPKDWTQRDSLLAAARTAVVRDYLLNTWGLESGRLPMQVLPDAVATSSLNRNDWREEQQRVELTSDTYDITAPVFVRTAADRVVPETLEYEAEWTGETPLADWNLTVAAPSGYQRSWIGGGNLSTVRFNIPSAKLLNIDTELRAELTGTTSDQAAVEAETAVAMEWLSADGAETGNDVRREKFSLILFEYNSDELLNNNRQILELVRSRIESRSLVTVLGYADRTGTPRFNRDLALRRCNNVRDFLIERGVNGSIISVQAVGSDIVLHDNALPEGRNYSRTVQILVTTPY